jgi:hypothetical protein
MSESSDRGDMGVFDDYTGPGPVEPAPTPITVPERVKAGIALLDRVMPGWRAKINLDELYMGSIWKCVLGQMHKDYYEGCEALNRLTGVDRGRRGV